MSSHLESFLQRKLTFIIDEAKEELKNKMEIKRTASYDEPQMNFQALDIAEMERGKESECER